MPVWAWEPGRWKLSMCSMRVHEVTRWIRKAYYRSLKQLLSFVLFVTDDHYHRCSSLLITHHSIDPKIDALLELRGVGKKKITSLWP